MIPSEAAVVNHPANDKQPRWQGKNNTQYPQNGHPRNLNALGQQRVHTCDAVRSGSPMTDRKPATNVGARKLPTAPAPKLRGGSVIRCIHLDHVFMSLSSSPNVPISRQGSMHLAAAPTWVAARAVEPPNLDVAVAMLREICATRTRDRRATPPPKPGRASERRNQRDWPRGQNLD